MTQISLKNAASKKTLFFYFSENTCAPCIEETIEILKMIFPSYTSNERILFISPKYPIRFRDNFYGKKLTTLKAGVLGIPLENTEAPFFFVLNDKLEIESIHVVNKTKFYKTEEYLQKMSEKLGFK